MSELTPIEAAALNWRLVEPLLAEYLDEYDNAELLNGPNLIASIGRRNVLRNRLRVAIGRPAKLAHQASNHRRKR